ncbi:MAG: hypothetical protein QXS48_01120 [Candidatus Aenigmatarchaeota archaeon]
MVVSKRKGYRVERKIRKIFESYGWKVVRAGGSLGEADLICIKNKKCILLQIKSTNKGVLYYYGYSSDKFEGFPFYLIVDFGYGKIKITKPKEKITLEDGKDLETFLKKY